MTHSQSRLAAAAKPEPKAQPKPQPKAQPKLKPRAELKPKPQAKAHAFFAPQNLSDTSKGAGRNPSLTRLYSCTELLTIRCFIGDFARFRD